MAAAAVAVVAVAVTAAWFASIGTPGDELFRTYLNESGEIAALRLEDGTQVWMQDGTELQYAVGAAETATAPANITAPIPFLKCI